MVIQRGAFAGLAKPLVFYAVISAASSFEWNLLWHMMQSVLLFEKISTSGKVLSCEIIEAKILQNQGIIRIADIVAEGISKQYAIKYLQERDCERTAKGVYLAPDAWQADLYIIPLQ